MSSLNFLLTRQSNGLLQSPAPDATELSDILSAAMTVPDHASLSPFHFTVIQDKGLDKLTEIFTAAISIKTTDPLKIAKAQKMAYRAPMIIVVSTKYKDHPKVPESEQFLTSGCAVYAMQMACVAMGYQAMWRSGDLCFDPMVKSALNVSPENDIVGFLYVGTETKQLAPKKRKSFENFVSYWS